MTWFEELKNKLLTNALSGIIGLSTFLAGFFLKEIGPPMLETLLSSISRQSLLILLTLSLILNGMCLAFSCGLYKKHSKKIKRSDFELVKNKSYYKHKKTGDNYCGVCLANNVLMPLSETADNEFCLICCRCNKSILR